MSLTAFVVRLSLPALACTASHRAVSAFLEKLAEQKASQIDVGFARIDYASVYSNRSEPAIAFCPDPQDPLLSRTLVFDGWLENREELIAQLSVLDATPESSDPELVLKCIERWGTAAPKHLYGEYSFVCVEKSQHSDVPEVFAVRDKVGIRPLFFATIDGAIAISNFPGALSVIPWVGSEINEGYAAEFLCADVNSIDETLYKHVRRLRGGCFFRSTLRSSVTPKRYWYPPSHVTMSDAPRAAVALRKRLDHVVGSALRAPGLVGVQMSGGIDSSSVACVVAGLVDAGAINAARVRGMSQIYPGLPCDETAYIEALETVLPFDVQKLKPTYADAALLDSWSERLRHPVFSFASTASLLHDRHHRNLGGGVVVTGEGGDELFQPTSRSLFALSSLGHLSIAVRHVRQTYDFFSGRVNARGAIALTLESVAPAYFRNVLRRMQRLRKNWKPSVDAAWAERVKLRRRLDRLRVSGAARTLAVELALTGGAHYALEHMYESNFVRGIEKRCPLLSASILEFVNQLPLELMDSPTGRSRQLLRESVRERLPALIRDRMHKSEFTASVLPALVELATQRFGRNFVRPPLGKAGRSSLSATANRYVWQLDAAQAYRAWLTAIGQSDS